MNWKLPVNRIVHRFLLSCSLPLTVGCLNVPQHPVEGCVHPVAYTFERVEDLRDGIAMEYGQARFEDDTNELRIDMAKSHVAAKTAPARGRLHNFLYGPKPRWIP